MFAKREKRTPSLREEQRMISKSTEAEAGSGFEQPYGNGNCCSFCRQLLAHEQRESTDAVFQTSPHQYVHPQATAHSGVVSKL